MDKITLSGLLASSLAFSWWRGRFIVWIYEYGLDIFLIWQNMSEINSCGVSLRWFLCYQEITVYLGDDFWVLFGDYFYKNEPGLFLVSNWNWANLNLILPEIMCLDMFLSRSLNHFQSGNLIFIDFAQMFTPKNEAGNSYINWCGFWCLNPTLSCHEVGMMSTITLFF